MLRTSLIIGICAFSSFAYADDEKLLQTDFRSNVNGVCQILSIDVPANNNVSAVIVPTGVTLAFNRFVDNQTLEPVAFSLQVNINARCNFAHQLSVLSKNGGFSLQGANGATNGFETRRNYQTSVSWAGASASFNTNGQTNFGVNLGLNGAVSDTLSIAMNAPSGGNPLVAGTYGDVLLINLSGAP